ncbi:hypothetical protein BHE74_00023554 [Ensete ventricosum]|nr:hypothetical protein BHE74_00023554 [Ensete ventricosum]
MMLKVFPEDDLESTAHNRNKEQEKGIHLTPTTMIPSISMLALPEHGNVFVLGVDISRVGIGVTQDGASKGGRGSNEGTSVAEGAATTLGSSGGRGGDEDAIARMVAAAGQCWREQKQQRWICRQEGSTTQNGQSRLWLAEEEGRGQRQSSAVGNGGKRWGGEEKGATVLLLAASFSCMVGKKKGAAGSDEGYRREGGLLAAVGGTVNVAGQRLVVAAVRWPRAREGGGSGVSVSSAQRWLQLRAREAAVEVALEEKGRWWPTVGAGEEEGEAAMAVAGSGGEEKGDGRGYSQEGTVDEGGEESGGQRG